MGKFYRYLQEEDGGPTVDWVTVTAGVLLLGMAVVYGVFNDGVSDLMAAINTELEGPVGSVAIGDAPTDLNQ